MEKNTKIETRKGCFQTLINIYHWKSRKTKKEDKAAPKGKLHVQSNDKSHEWRKGAPLSVL